MQGEYTLTYGAVGTRVVLIASEPITGSASDWVAVPRNTALIVSRDKGGCLNLLSSPLGEPGMQARRLTLALRLSCARRHAPGSGLSGAQRHLCCVCCRRAARRLRAAWRLPWARPRSPAARGTSSTPAERPVGPQQAALTARVPGRAGAQGSACQCVTRLVRRADAGAAREGRAGRGQLHGGAGRADSTPGALWLDGAAKVVAGEEQRLAGHHGPVLCLALSGDRLFSSSTDLTIKVHPRALRHGEPSDLPCSCSPACRTMIRPVLTMRLHASAFTASVLTMRLHAPPGNPC